MSDTFIEIEVKVRYYGGAYIARAGRFQAICTGSETWAAQTAAAKAFNAEPRLLKNLDVKAKHVVIARHDVKASTMVCRLYLVQPLESEVDA